MQRASVEIETRFIPLLISVAIGCALWYCPVPDGLTSEAMHLVAIFVASLIAIILKVLPMGAVTLLALTTCLITKTLTFRAAFDGFSHPIVWLVVLAFFIAKGFTVTGLGTRIGYIIVALLGKKSIGLGYGLAASELILAPAIPSMAARAGGIIYPIVLSLSRSFGSDPALGTSRKIGSYLTLVALQGNLITSAMFLTAMAANPLIVSMAAEYGVKLSWTSWALAAIVPGMINLLLMPWILLKLCRPEILKTPHAAGMAREKLREIGPISRHEWMMLATFGLLLVLWIGGAAFGIDATVAALIGLAILLLTGVLKWDHVIGDKSAWDTLFWFAVLITLAGEVNRLGFSSWLGSNIVPVVQGFPWPVAFLLMALAYFYTHYFFASNTAHVASMFGAFLAGAIVLGTPPLVATLVLGFFSSLFGGLTHYGSGSAAVLYGAHYVSMREWWVTGVIMSFISILIWVGVGTVWWKILGLY